MALKQKYLALELAHKSNLAELGVKLPLFENSKGGCKKGYALTILYANFGKFMHIDAIKKKSGGGRANSHRNGPSASPSFEHARWMVHRKGW